MRSHPRPTALLAVLSLLVALVVTIGSISPAEARPRKRARRARAVRVVAPATPENFQRLRQCESRGDYSVVSRNGRYFGAYQFSPVTWRSLGYEGLPNLAPAEVQDEAATRLQARSGWKPWPRCSRRLARA